MSVRLTRAGMMILSSDEKLTSGTRMYRTWSEEAQSLAITAEFAETKEERKKAEYRLEKISKWEHYCPEHVKEIGIL